MVRFSRLTTGIPSSCYEYGMQINVVVLSRKRRPLRLCMRYWGLRTLNIIIFYLFFYKIYKGDLPLIYSCIFWCEFIDLVGFFCCYFVTLVTPFIIRSKGCTGKQPTVRTLSTRRRFAGPKTHQIGNFFARGKVLTSLHLSKSLNV